MSTPVPPVPPIVGKPGSRTSELYLAVAWLICLILGAVFHRDLSGSEPLVAGAAGTIVTSAYALSRAITKVGVVRALSTASVRTSLVTALGAVETGGSGYTVKMGPAPVEPAPMAAAVPPPTIPSPPPPLSTDEQATLAGLLARQSPPTVSPPAAVEPVVASV